MAVARAWLAAALAIQLLLTAGQNVQQKTCTRDGTAVIQPGSAAWIGGIIGLNTFGSGGYGCGQAGGSMQSYEAIRWVLDLLNKKGEYLQTQYLDDYYVPGIKLGMHVKNYCQNDMSATAALPEIYPELLGDQASCTEDPNKLTIGIIGPSRSDDAITLSNAANPLEIPLVSYEATAPQLTMPNMYRNFMRTISPDGPLMDVVVEVITRLKWNYIVVVYDSGVYGRTGYNELHTRLVAAGICLTTGLMINANDLSGIGNTMNAILGTGAVGAIYVGPQHYALELIKEGNRKLTDAGRLQWLVIDFPLDAQFETTSVYQRGIISITAASRFIVEFEDHWIRIDEKNPSSENPWFKEWYEQRFNCKINPLAGEKNCADLYAGKTANEKERQKRLEYQQDQFVEAAVMAVFTYANALRKAQMEKCPGVSGICENLRKMQKDEFMEKYLKKVDFIFSADERVPSLASNFVPPYNSAKRLSFTPNGDISDPSYYIWNYNNIETGSAASNVFKFRRIGSFVNGRLDMNLDNIGMYGNSRQDRLVPLPSSPCPARGCNPCLSLPAEMKYYFEKGDVVINGFFSLHKSGMTPLACGPAMSDNQFMYMEAMIYAIKKINEDTSVLKNIRLGGLGMDDCSSGTLGQMFLAQVQRGNLKISDRAGYVLDPKLIEAYTAAHTASLTLPLAEAMNMLMRPMVGYRASSSQLDDKSRYPYYILARPGIHEEMKAIVLLLKKLNWMYVQVVTSDKDYSTDAEKVFRMLAAREGICIVARHNIGQTDMAANQTVMGLQANNFAPPTILLLDMMDNRRLLTAFSGMPAARASVALIGTSMWGTSELIVEGLESVAEGLISISLQHSTLDSFKRYLGLLDVTTYMLNPWFREWYAFAHNCTFTGMAGLSACNATKPITDGPRFRLMNEVDSVINAVKAIARGLDSTLKFFCGNDYTTICSAFYNSPIKGMKFLEEIKKVSFQIEDMSAPNTFRFEDNYGAIPFEINNYNQKTYKKVGDIMTWTNTLTLTSANPVTLYNNVVATSVIPTCPSPCLDCLYVFNHLQYWYVPGDVVLGAIFDIHYAGPTPFSCGPLRVKNGALYTEVFNFALQKINSGTASVKLNGVTLGGLAFDGCTNPPRATAIVNRVHTGMEIKDTSGKMFDTTHLMSWMTYDSQTTIDAAKLLQKLNMPVVSPGATAHSLDNKQEFYTFFRTIPSDSLIVRGMAEFANKMGWKYVIVVNSPDTSNRESRDLFRQYLADFGICVVASYEFERDGNVNIIMQSIITSDTQVVAVFAEPEKYIAEFLQAKAAFPRELKFIANRPWGIKNRPDLENSVFFDMERPTITEFTTYLRGRQVFTNNNPWFRSIYEEVFKCNLPGTFTYTQSCSATSTIPDNSNWEQDIWTLSTINAVYAVAQAVHKTLQDKCGVAYSGMCVDFIYGSDVHNRIMKHMDDDTFTDIASLFFDFVERELDREYKLMRYTSTGIVEKKGSLSKNSQLQLLDHGQMLSYYKNIRSECRGECLVCQASDANLQDYTFIPGDIYIVGLFDVHKRGGTPFTCGAINDKHGLPLLEAFNYALEYVNNKMGIFSNKLTGVQIGGIGLDICQSASRAANLVANIHSGNINLARGGTTIDPRRIDAYIGTMDTKSSLRVADILTQLAIPQISYGATGMDLLNRDKYRYFLRSVPADDKQARAMVSFLRRFKFNNIQVVSSFDEVGDPGRKEFMRLALVNKICVKISYNVNERGNMDADAADVIKKIASRTDAGVIVLWLNDPLPVLEAANQNSDVVQKFLFVATDKWGADPAFLTYPGIQGLLANRNLVILDVETADIPSYDHYLDSKTPDNYQSNPWFKDYFEMHQQCIWDAPTGSNPEPCDKSATIPRADHYFQDPYVLYVINAVFSAAMGIHNAIESLCRSVNGACNLYLTSGERRQHVMQGLLKVNFTDDTHQPFFYTEDGQSDRGFHIYNITAEGNPQVFSYENVGSYNDSHFLKLDITYDSKYTASCDADRSDPNVPDCVCEFPPDLPSRFMKKEEGKRGITVAYIGDIHQVHPTNKLACGPINTGVDFQKLLAFFYAIDRINANTGLSIQDSIKLDGLALDSCPHNLRLGQDVYNILSGNQLCDTDEYGLVVPPSSIVAFVIDKDKNAIPVSRMLSLEKVTSISPTAGHPILSDRFYYPYLLRTRGDYILLARVILEVARRMGWDYLSVVYTDTVGNQGARDALLENSRGYTTCVGGSQALNPNATLNDAKNVLEKLTQQVGARAVVLFVEPKDMRLLMEASQALGYTGRFVWVVPSDWAHDGSNIGGLEQEAAGAIMVETRSAILADFNNYMKSLTFTNRLGLPDDWFEEAYEGIHQCNIVKLQSTTSKRYPRSCTNTERITDEMVAQNPAVFHVILSVYAIALGLQNVPKCTGSSLDIAACLQIQDDRKDLIYESISGVSFQELPSFLGSQPFAFSFDRNGNGEAGFIIRNFQASSTVQLGEYTRQGLTLNTSAYAGLNLYTRGLVPSSSCGTGTTCTCELPKGRTWQHTPAALLDPSNVQVGRIYRDPNTGSPVRVKAIPTAGDRFDEAWAIIITVIASVGGAIALCLFLYLVVMYPVRGGTSILGFILSFGIILLYLMVFPFIAHADERICGLRRFGLGFVYSIVYSALMVKLVDCWRVRGKEDSYSTKYSKLGRPAGLFLVTVFFVLVQVMINVEWLILEVPNMVRIFYKDEFWPRCTPEDFYDEGLVLYLVYIMVIIFVSFILGLLSFNSTKNHQEARWILGILLVSILCWVIWCTVSILGAKKIRDAAVAIGLLVNATTMLLLVPIRKLYLLHKYNVLIDEEEEEAKAADNRDYGSVYGHQYDNNPMLHDSGSTRGDTYNSPRSEDSVRY